MALNVILTLAIWQSVVALITLIIVVKAITRFREKRSLVAYLLFWAFLFFFLAIISQDSNMYAKVFGIELEELPGADNPIVLKYIYSQWNAFQFSYYTLIIGLYFLFRFSLAMMSKKGEKRQAEIAALVVMIILIVYGLLIKPNLEINGEVLSIIAGVDIWVILYAFFLMTPISRESKRLLRRVPKDDPSYPKLRYLSLLPQAILLMIICFIVETIYGIFTNEYFNLFSFIAWFLAIPSLWFGYAGLYKK